MKRWLVFFVLIGLLAIAFPIATQDDPHLPITYGETITYDMTANAFVYFDFEGHTGDIVMATVTGAVFGDSLYGQIGSRDTGWSRTGRSNGLAEPLIYLAILPEDRLYSFTLGNSSGDKAGIVTVTFERLESRTADTGRSLAYGEAVVAALDTDILRHSWWFEGQTGDLIALSAIMPRVSGAGGVDLRVYSPDGALLNPPDSREISGVAQTSQLREFMLLPQTGTYRVDFLRLPQMGDEEELLPFNYLIRLETPPMTTLTYGQTYNSQLATGADREILTFAGTAGETVFVDLTSDNASLIYRVVGAAAPVFIDGTYSHRWVLLDDGLFAVEVYDEMGARGDGRTFTLALTRESESPVTPIQYGETVALTLTGTIPPVLRFEGAAGDLVSIDIPSEHFISYTAFGGTGVYTEDIDSGPHSGSLLPNIRLPNDGKYTILPHNYHGQSMAGYRINVRLEQVNPSPTLTYGETINGTLRGGTVDLYTFEGKAGEQVTAFLQGSGGMIPSLRLFGPGGLVAGNINTLGSSMVFIPNALLQQDGLYTLVVDELQGGGGTYTLTADNGIAQNVTPITYGQKLEDVQLAAGAWHFYQFEGSAGDKITLRCPQGILCTIYGPTHFYLIVPSVGLMPTLPTRPEETGLHMLVIQSADTRVTTYTLDFKGKAFQQPEIPDTDGDGLTDPLDRCPSEAGTLDGCPAVDTDGDGVPDLRDACPDVAGSADFAGCPDTDGDGVPDSRDACPEEPGSLAARGCPDADNDGIVDADDACPETPGLALFDGCPDTDGDGIPDASDACPDAPGIAEFDGCGFYGRVANNANLRAGTGTNFDVVGTVASGDEILILGRSAAGDWLRVRVGDVEAWLFASLVTSDADLAALPVVE